MSGLSGDRNIKHPQQQQPSSQHIRIIVNPLQQQITDQNRQLIQQLSSNLVNNSNLNTTTGSLNVNSNETILRITSTDNVNSNNNQNNYIYSTTPQPQLIQQPIASTSTSSLHQNNINVTPTATNQQKILQLQVPSSGTVLQTTPTTHHLSPTSPIARKRLKLETLGDNTVGYVNVANSSVTSLAATEIKPIPQDDIVTIKKQILDFKIKKLRSLKEK